jgi:PAS domain S-box-containing protein
LALREARANFNKDQAIRHWATSHNGVYVFVDERTPPSPYLSHIPERDIKTPSGKLLTLMNPAYMIRQLMEDYADQYGIKGHITSLKPLRPENFPDKWEKKALESFETGVDEVFEFTEIDGEPYLRLIRPMIALEGCLKCHGFQGYKVGDVRGGVGVSLSMSSLLNLQHKSIRILYISHGLILFLGLAGVTLATKNIKQSMTKHQRAEEALTESKALYKDLYDNAPDMYISVDATTTKLLQCNQTLLRATGYTKGEIIGCPVFNLYHPDCMEEAKKIFKLFITTGEIQDAELQLKRKDGTKIEVSLNISSIRDKQGKIIRSRSVWRDITKRKQAEEKLYLYQKQLQSLASELSLAEEHERRRIATGLHDEIGQTLYVSKITLEALQETTPSVDLAQSLERVTEDIKQTINYVRKLTFELGSPILYELGFGAALKGLTEKIHEQHGILSYFEEDKEPKPLNDEVCILLYQSVRELLINVIKHAQASSVKVSFKGGGNNIRINVNDDGIGFDSSSFNLNMGKDGGFGLFKIKERLDYLSGYIEIKSEHNYGTRVSMVVPLNIDNTKTKKMIIEHKNYCGS